MLNLVVKRNGQDEKFDEKKLYASVYASMLASQAPQKQAELIADEVTKLIKRWVEGKSHVTSHDLRLEASKHLREYHHLASYIYTHHRTLS